ncbi:chemotaxis protein CheA [Angustibacter luteus]|uniref:histidine kinase n=1 Tax=Angustibacter luteus TaxID=658456 RepID=A0ABW1JIQ9_9ACTN
MDDTDEIVQEFLVESHENLDQLDRDFVELEREPGSRELLASVFRTIHTIKGTSGFLAFSRLEALTHVGENLLARLRDGKLTMTAPIADVLLAMVDGVRELLAAIEVDGTEGSVEVAPIVARIQAVLDGDVPVAAAGPAPVVETVVETVVEAVVEDVVEAEVESVVDAVVEAVVEPAPVVQAAAVAPVVPAEVVADEPDVPTGAKRSVADSSIRVDVDLLDSLMRQVGELVLCRNQIVRQAGLQDDVDLVRASQRLNLIASELQEGVMKTRMQPIDHLWSKLPRVVRDLGAQCGKQVRLEMVGRETELDRTLLEAVKDPLTHLVRNAVDHGLEGSADRVAAGKSAEGVLTLRAFHEGGQVVVEVTDDGAGIDPSRIRAKMLEKGLRTAAQLDRLNSVEVLQLIFTPGFSTAAAVTNVSGRGVGMDVVKTNIESIGGTIEIESVLGRGTTCRLRIPLTLAIVSSLTIECAGDRYAIPQVNLAELVALDSTQAASSLERVGAAEVFRLRGMLLPIVRLSDVLELDPGRADGQLVIAVLQTDGRRFGLLVDRVLNSEEIVVKPLSSQLKSIGIYSGATILGDGAVALILDVQALAKRCMRQDSLERDLAQQRGDSEHAAELDQVLLAGIGEGRQVAIPLSMVTRLEQVDASRVERVGRREVIQYRGGILPTIRLDQHLHAESARGDELTVIVYTSGGRSVALVVEEIVDIVDDVDVRSDIEDDGLLGSAVVRDRVIELLDVRSAIQAADPNFFTVTEAVAAGHSVATEPEAVIA